MPRLPASRCPIPAASPCMNRSASSWSVSTVRSASSSAAGTISATGSGCCDLERRLRSDYCRSNVVGALITSSPSSFAGFLCLALLDRLFFLFGLLDRLRQRHLGGLWRRWHQLLDRLDHLFRLLRCGRWRVDLLLRRADGLVVLGGLRRAGVRGV